MEHVRYLYPRKRIHLSYNTSVLYSPTEYIVISQSYTYGMAETINNRGVSNKLKHLPSISLARGSRAGSGSAFETLYSIILQPTTISTRYCIDVQDSSCNKLPHSRTRLYEPHRAYIAIYTQGFIRPRLNNLPLHQRENEPTNNPSHHDEHTHLAIIPHTRSPLEKFPIVKILRPRINLN